MSRPSRMSRLGAWFRTLGRSISALFYWPNLKNAYHSVTKNWKEYACFYLAALLVTSGFWVIALTTDANLHEARKRVENAYDYHMEVAVLDNEQFANLDAKLIYETVRENEYIDSFYWANDKKPLADGTYTAYIRLAGELPDAYAVVEHDILGDISTERREIRLSPLYTFEEDFHVPYTTQFWAVSLLWLAFSVVLIMLLFFIRLDYFRFVYGIYMACGADQATLIGIAGGEIVVLLGVTLLPAALLGIGLTVAITLPFGIGLGISLRGILTVLFGGFLSALIAVWFPMRRLSRRAPVSHLARADHAAAVSSPRGSFAFGKGAFPIRYELYGFVRMRKYYVRLVLSAVLFAVCFVSGLYMVDMDTQHGNIDPAEYLVAYRPDSYYDYMDSIASDETVDDADAETEELPPQWTLDHDEAAMVWEDVDLFLSDLEAIPGVSHATWDVSLPGGRTLSHLLLTGEQVYRASENAVTSEERPESDHKWAINTYAYTAMDKTWIDNAISHNLCTFEGDPYAILGEGRSVIISENIYNDQLFSFKPGDTVIVAVCDKASATPLVLDPKQNLRNQIDAYVFHYETFTVAAVMRGMASESNITFGVNYDRYASLTNTAPSRTDLTVYMKEGTDFATVRAADGEIRGLLTSFMDWTVTPTGNYFDAQVRGLKNDSGLIMSLAACLLLASPMIWYFSQLMFYRRRRHEFDMLRALGAPARSFATLHRLAGGGLASVAFLATVLMALACNTLVYFAVNTFLPKMGLIESVHYDISFSLPAIIACVLVSVLCGFLSCEVPYRLLSRRDPAGRSP